MGDASAIITKFKTLVTNLRTNNDALVSQRNRAITKRLNKDFWESESETDHSRYVGSYGRGTAIRGFSDVDLLFKLPVEYYWQYDAYTSNGQSALLQAVKNSIKTTYPSTDVGGDGQVVVVSFTDGMKFEVVPGFLNKDGKSYTFPDANGGGSWKVCKYLLEIEAINESNNKYNKKVKHLTRMMKAWRNKNAVPITGLLIETLAMQFLDSWEHKDKSFAYYDWMTRDFLLFLSTRDKDQGHWLARGSGQFVYRTGAFESKAKSSYEDAIAAIEYEGKNFDYSANDKWKAIFGPSFTG